MVLYSKLCIDFCHYFKLVLFFPQQREKKKVKPKYFSLETQSSIQLHLNSCMLCIKVGLGNILSVQISVLIWLILIRKSNCVGDEGINKKFQGFLYDFEKRQLWVLAFTDRKAMPCLLCLVLSSVTVTLITTADASYFLS